MGHPPPPILSGSGRLAAVALLSLFVMINLHVSDHRQRQAQEGYGGLFGDYLASNSNIPGMNGAPPPRRHYFRGVTVREAWITPSSQPFVRKRNRAFQLMNICARGLLWLARGVG
jgi:hypothetical protein